MGANGLCIFRKENGQVRTLSHLAIPINVASMRDDEAQAAAFTIAKQVDAVR